MPADFALWLALRGEKRSQDLLWEADENGLKERQGVTGPMTSGFLLIEEDKMIREKKQQKRKEESKEGRKKEIKEEERKKEIDEVN